MYEIFMYIEKEFWQIFYYLRKQDFDMILSKKDVSILIGFYILDTNT